MAVSSQDVGTSWVVGNFWRSFLYIPEVGQALLGVGVEEALNSLFDLQQCLEHGYNSILIPNNKAFLGSRLSG